ncbi:MAG: siderophore-interacting protein [Aquamicrobium sp.]|uniref:SIP domain-containing protein n=1 Tax=Aquamicrobium sp. TaxID=1872579 RepID=UPI00349E4D33|nr:siderophore-interacting protein [Aquamicrobium sp.]
MLQTTTLLTLAPESAFMLLKAGAALRALPVEEREDGLKLTLPWGEVVAAREAGGVRLTLSASDRARLHSLQEANDRPLDEAALCPDRRWSFAETGANPPNMTFMAVVSCRRMTPSYYRVCLSGPSVERFAREGLHFRLLFAPADHAGEWPVMNEAGRTEWPGGMGAWHRPVYTVRTIDAGAGTLEFDVFAHPGGRVTTWCETLQPGAQIAIIGPGGEWYPRAGWMALFGDETALPAIARILEGMPEDGAGIATIMIGDPGDIQEMKRPEAVSVRWLVRGRDTGLVEALAALEMPSADRFVWFAGERAETAAARKLMGERGLAKTEMRAAVYWTR